ncbi:MAG: amidohydrolase family protein [Acidimicrobiales bacterium]
MSEAGTPGREGTTRFDSALGLALRRWCAPVLDLEPWAGPEAYLRRRSELGAGEVNRRLLGACGTEALFVDTGYRGDELVGLDGLAALAGAPVAEIVRLETVAEKVDGGADGGGFAGRFAEELHRQAASAVGLKSVVAYRYGLDIDPTPPGPAEVRRAADAWLGSGRRLSDQVLLRHLLWEGLRLGLPLQLHTGFGDSDLDLHRSDPSLLTELVRAAADLGTPIMLLHCYPYHRQAAYLASVYEHVYLDIGLATPYVGHRAGQVLAEVLELAPFDKVLYSSDAFGLPELYYISSAQFREALAEVLQVLLSRGLPETDAARIGGLIASENARRVYRFDPAGRPGLMRDALRAAGGP